MRIFTLLLAIFFASAVAASDTAVINVSQTIRYTTEKANEIYVVWALNNWEKAPHSEYWPEGSFFRDGDSSMLYSKMLRQDSVFHLNVCLPQHTLMNYMFWIPVDNKGDSTDGWDTYGDLMYSSIFDKDRIVDMDDGAIWLPEKKRNFNILKNGWTCFFITLGVVLTLLVLYRKKLRFSLPMLLGGFFVSFLIAAIFIRMQMNDLAFKSQYKLFGSVYHDLVYMIVFFILFAIALYLLRNIKWAQWTLLVIFSILFIVSVLFSYLNIEIVKEIGKPLNIQWLYYSDFMKGTDAKNAVAYKMSDKLGLNLALLVGSCLLFAFAFSFLPGIRSKKTILILSGVFFLLFMISVVQHFSTKYAIGKTENPVVAFLSSLLTANKKPQLFSMKVSGETQKYIEDYHTTSYPDTFAKSAPINNIILFVLESTPKKYVDVYDSTFRVTPNLQKWKNNAAVFTNVYSHIPSTPNSMATMISGIYPMISYKSIINEFSKVELPSIARELAQSKWSTSFFSSADLSFGDMEDYAKRCGFTTVVDSRSMTCNYERFHVTNTMLDGLDDRCVANEYFNWFDKNKTEKKFSIIWNNQTHYPYFVNQENEKKIVEGNPELNRFLNALSSTDESFGLLMDGLSQRNELNNTLVIVVGDHGEAFGSHGQKGHASKIYEENVNVPCIFFNPTLFSGETNEKLAGLVDLTPTIAHILGLERKSIWEGKSLFIKSSDDRAFFLCPYTDMLLGTRTENWKYIFNVTENSEELYDLKADPLESKNLSKKHPEIANREFEMIGGWVQYHNEKLDRLKK